MNIETLIVFAMQIGILLVGGCGRRDFYGFGVEMPPGNQATVRFSDGHTWPNFGGGTVMATPGSVPDSVDINWTDNQEKTYHQHIQITPLPPPTATSYTADVRMVYFVLQPDHTFKLVNHNPDFSQ